MLDRKRSCLNIVVDEWSVYQYCEADGLGNHYSKDARVLELNHSLVHFGESTCSSSLHSKLGEVFIRAPKF